MTVKPILYPNPVQAQASQRKMASILKAKGQKRSRSWEKVLSSKTKGFSGNVEKIQPTHETENAEILFNSQLLCKLGFILTMLLLTAESVLDADHCVDIAPVWL